MLVGVAVALLIGFPCLRVKGPYLGLVTMAFPVITVSIIYYFKDFTGGLGGIYGIPKFFPKLPYYQRGVAEYYLTLLLLFLSAIALYKIANSKTGMVFVSILDDELASKASGINVTKYKLMAFAISGLFASLAGSINAHLISGVSIGDLSLNVSFMPLIMMIIGGIGTIYGPIAGAFILQILDQYILTKVVDVPSDWHYIIYAGIVIILIIKWSKGLSKFVVEDILEELEDARDIEERGKHIWKRYKKEKK
jgi:branched-chain amino acid transport system permease protein